MESSGYMRAFKPVVAVWRACSRVYVQFYRAWDPSSSMIQAFASLFFLTHAKLNYLLWEVFQWREGVNDERNAKSTEFFYIDPTVSFNSTKYAMLITFSVVVAVFVFLPPLLILVVYPTSLYRKISHCISRKWRLRMKTYVEIFHGCFKDGTNGTRDYRSSSGLVLLFFGVLFQLLSGISGALAHKYDAIVVFYVGIAFFSFMTFLCALLQPYKEKGTNDLTIRLLVIANLTFAIAAGVYNNQESEIFKFTMFALLLIPHLVLWGYVAWKLVKILCISGCKYADKFETERLLQRTGVHENSSTTNNPTLE